ncbi:MAG TPA: hypothetical protein PK819_01465 [Thermomicrobiales bacterium]|nr:hypothetical protein [Thermomicrobiales bacterium]
MDVMVSSSWRSSASVPNIEALVANDAYVAPVAIPDPFIFRSGRYEVKLSSEGSSFRVEYSSSGRLFGPREVIYSERHIEPRHAAWDVMCRVIRATDDEATGISIGRSAMAWLQQFS